MTGIIAAMGGTPQSNAPATGATPTGSAATPDLAGLTFSPDLLTSTLGGSTNIGSAAFDPALYGPGAIFSPTGAQPTTPEQQQAQQDPSGQTTPEQRLQQTVDRTGKGDQPPQEQTVDRTGKGDLAQPPAGPTGLGGDQTVDRTGKGDLGALVRTAMAGGQTDLPQLARSAAATGGQPSPTAAVDQPPTQTPQPVATPQAAAPQAAGQRQPGARAATGPEAAAPGAQPQSLPGAAPAGVPGLLQAILNMLGLGGLTGGGQPLQAIAQQAYPQRPIGPIAPTAGLGPYARARARAQGQPGQYQQPTQEEWTRNVSAGRGLGPAPAATGEVSAPTAQQVQQSRLAGTDTPPTEGFSPVLERERAKFRQELDDPRTRWETLAMIALEEGGDPAAVAESLLNRSDYAKTSIRNALHSGFYGPINFGKLGGEIRRLQADPARAAKLNAGLETALRGSNLLGGATDQGSAGDPNAGHRGGRVIRFGEIYNDWGGGPGGHAGAANYRRQQQQRVRAGQRETQRGTQLSMDITRRIPITGGAEMEPGGGMVRRGAPATEFENITEQRRKRERERARAGLMS